MTERHSTPQDDELPKRLLSRAAAAESMIPRVGGASTDAGRTFEKDAKLFRDAAAALEDWRGRLAEMCGRVLATQSESASTDEKGRPMTYWGGMATPQSAGTSTTPGRIPELEATRINAEYWLAEAKHPDVEHSSAIMFAEQAINAWKNAAYAMADRFVSSARTESVVPLDIIELAETAVRRYLWMIEHPKAPIAGGVSFDDAMAKLRTALVILKNDPPNATNNPPDSETTR